MLLGFFLRTQQACMTVSGLHSAAFLYTQGRKLITCTALSGLGIWSSVITMLPLGFFWFCISDSTSCLQGHTCEISSFSFCFSHTFSLLHFLIIIMSCRFLKTTYSCVWAGAPLFHHGCITVTVPLSFRGSAPARSTRHLVLLHPMTSDFSNFFYHLEIWIRIFVVDGLILLSLTPQSSVPVHLLLLCPHRGS